MYIIYTYNTINNMYIYIGSCLNIVTVTVDSESYA